MPKIRWVIPHHDWAFYPLNETSYLLALTLFSLSLSFKFVLSFFFPRHRAVKFRSIVHVISKAINRVYHGESEPFLFPPSLSFFSLLLKRKMNRCKHDDYSSCVAVYTVILLKISRVIVYVSRWKGDVIEFEEWIEDFLFYKKKKRGRCVWIRRSFVGNNLRLNYTLFMIF